MTDLAPPLQTLPPPRRRRRGAAGAWLLISVLLIAAALGFAALALTGKPIKLPVWAVAEVETRLNKMMSRSQSDMSLSVGAIELMVDADFVPRLAFEDLRILQSNGTALVTLPEVRSSFDPKALLKGSFQPQSLRIIGGRFAIKRNADGRLNLDFGGSRGGGNGGPTNQRAISDVIDTFERVFARPGLDQLKTVEAEALTLILTDARSGQQWQAGDGRLVLENRPDDFAAELGLTLAVDQTRPARILLTSVSDKSSLGARLSAKVDGIAARDLAAQVVPLAWLAALDAPISGRMAATIDDQGRFGTLESTLEFGAGVLRPTPQTAPIAFDRAGMSLAYDPALGRILISALSVESASLRLTATGQSYILDDKGIAMSGSLIGARPAAFLTQIAVSKLRVDPAGLFEAPVEFSQGALDLRLTLNPFALDIGQLTLSEADTHLALQGRIGADPKGWRVALDVALDQIEPGKLIALWPVRLVTKTREWLALNVLDGTLFDVKAAVRLAPEAETQLSLGYAFKGTDVRFLKALPPIRAGSGYSNIEGKAYTLVLEDGYVSPPVGGNIAVAGTVFRIADITQRPTIADITLKTQSSLTASLSLLDQPPFGFLTKAKRPVDLGLGTATLTTKLSFPLKAKVLIEDVSYAVTGKIENFQSDVLVPGRRVQSPLLSVMADKTGMNISGRGLLDTVPFDATFRQEFGPAAKGRAKVDASVTISDAALREFGVALPKGMIKGEGTAKVNLALAPDQPAALTLTTDLAGLGLDLPALGWSKPPPRTGTFEVQALLGKVPKIQSLSFEAGGLRANGSITLTESGALQAAQFERVQLDDWLDAAITLEGRGQGRPVGVLVNSGTVDLRRLAVKRSTNDGSQDGPMQVRLDRMTVSDGIALTDFRGEFTSKGGFNGSFSANVNGAAPVRGTVVPSAAGSAVRIQAKDAGQVLAAASIFANARGGDLDLQLVPTGAEGEYKGRAKIGTIRVKNASVLAELLSAISVVGVLEQLNESGLVFTQADVDFRLTPDAIEVTRGSAIGASLGVSMAGVYQSGPKTLVLQGVISPIYLLNGIGSFLTRKGEGLFGFNYKIRGTVDAPKISVNPLSILTPGMFRDLFRKPAPVLE